LNGLHSDFLPFGNLDDDEFEDILVNNEKINFDLYCSKIFSPFASSDRYNAEYSPDILLDPQIIYDRGNCEYYELDEYIRTAELAQTEKNFMSVHLNIRSIPKNLEEFVHDFSLGSRPYDVVAFTETRLSEELNDIYYIDNYNIFSNPRNTHGGGVAIYVRDKHSACIIEDLTVVEPHLESVIVMINSGNVRKIVGCIYRPPKSNVQRFIELFGNLCSVMTGKYEGVTVDMHGDFNLDLFACDTNNNVMDYVLLMYSFFFYR
jgi:hypothetical protein